MQVIHSGGMDVDILPKGASKGDGLKFLLREARAFFFSLDFFGKLNLFTSQITLYHVETRRLL